MEIASPRPRAGTAHLIRSMWVRHVIAGALGLVLAYGFWLSRPEWDPEMRLWRAVGDASIILLYVTLAQGPLARLVPGAGRLLPYRRELGIWFGVLALIHTVLILNGWARWDVLIFLGYEFVPQLDRMVRLDSGFGLANVLGLTAMIIALPLLATSADWATRALGGNGWKFLHYSTYIIFWLLVLHTAYFLFVHFTEHFHKRPPPDPNWFRWPFVALTLAVAALQVSAYVKTVWRQRHRARQRGAELTGSARGQSGRPQRQRAR